jgi:hypothetical protein
MPDIHQTGPEILGVNVANNYLDSKNITTMNFTSFSFCLPSFPNICTIGSLEMNCQDCA